MARVAQFPLLLCAALGPSLFQTRAQTPPPAPPIRVSVDRVNVGVIVTDSRGHFIEALRRENFHVFDNGVEQPLTDFLSVTEPAQLLLLIESGPAVVFLGENHARAADTLLTALGPSDRVAIATYSRTPELIQTFTRDKAVARLSLQGMNFMAGFGELNLSSSLAAALDWLAQLPGKKSIVLLSTGVDTSPEAAWQAVQSKLQISDTRILAVSLSGDFRKPAKIKRPSTEERSDRAFVKQVFADADQALRSVAQATGGRVYFPADAKEFNRAYAEIAELVRHEYSLAFTPASRDAQLHSIKITTTNSAYRVDHRQAYVAPAP
jgi:Ca-activated chloride channel homolog